MAPGQGVVMPPLMVPEQHRAGLAAVLKLNPEAVDAVVATLSRDCTGAAASDMSRISTTVLPDVTPETVASIGRALLSLYTVLARYDQSAESLADDIIEAVSTQRYPELILSDEEREESRDRLRKLLSIDSGWSDDWYVEHQVPDAQSTPELERWFREQADTWRRQTGFMPIISKKVMHPAYQRIMAKGPAVLPLILRELRDRPDHWFWALSAIAGENPMRPDATFEQAVADWLGWGRDRGLID